MKFSIILPCFNSKSYINKCVDSILSQSFSDYELIVIDDGSTDGTSQILDEYASTYPHIHVHHFSNAGVSIARKRGISLATGEYSIFVDSDDTIEPNHLENLNAGIIKHNHPDIIRCQVNLINDSPHKDSQRYNFTSGIDILNSGIDSLKMWSIPGKKYAVYWLFAFKTSIFSKVTFHRTLRCYEDVALIPILIASSPRVVTINHAGYNYLCNNSDNLTNTISLEAECQRADAFYEACQFAIENFSNLEQVSEADISFFVDDYNRRLLNKYESLPEVLKPQFIHWFK